MTDFELEYRSADDILASARLTWRPPPDLKVSEFADEHIIVTSGPLESSKWNTEYMPYQRGILDAYFEPGIEIVVLQSSSQVGKTSIACIWVAYHIAHDPCPILFVSPTQRPMAEDISKNRLQPIIDNSPILSAAVSKKRAKDSSNTTYFKTFKGGSLSIGGANSAASLAQRTIRNLLLDEIDRYPAELPGEGNTIQIALKRTTTFRGRRRIAILSSPTLKDAPIDSWYHRGDQRRYYVPCFECGYMHPFAWKNVKWENNDPATARIHCPECDYGMNDSERIAILGRGEWRAENPDRREREIASFHLWEAYSPLTSLSSIVSGFLAAFKAMKAGDKSEMHTWQNTTLGEAIEEEESEKLDSDVLLARRHAYRAPVPQGAAVVTMGIDVQDDRVETLTFGWGPGEESWIIDRQDFPGDTSQEDVWNDLAVFLGEPPKPDYQGGYTEATFRHETGQYLPLGAACIDSAGHRTDEVYQFVIRMAKRRIFAIVGRDGVRPIISSPTRKKTRYGTLPLYTVGVDTAKQLLLDRFKVATPGRGYVHLPVADWSDEELAKQLTSEKRVLRYTKGKPFYEWQKTRPRNEALDNAVYALAALRLAHPDLEALHDALTAVEEAPPPPAIPPPRREPWIGRRPGGWLGRG